MEKLRGINLSLAVFVVICFFLPWVQVSCVGLHSSLSGRHLASEGDRHLWLIPLMMVMVFALGLGRDWKRRVMSFGLASVICGVVAALLIYRERVGSGRAFAVAAASMTAWFWLGFAAAIVIALCGVMLIIRRPPKGPIGS